MKKRILLTAAITLTAFCAIKAQGMFSENMFNHFAVGATAGTPGYGLDVATTVGNSFQLRVGFTTIPNVKMNTTLDISDATGEGLSEQSGLPESFDVEGKVNMTNFKILIDYFPFKKSSFHVTAGAYIGSQKLVQVYNKDDGALSAITSYNNQTTSKEDQLGLELGDYLLKPDNHGNVESDIKVGGFKPYLGIGFGRAVPRKNRVGFMFELGCQFWGSPKIYCNGDKLTSEDLGGSDGGAIKTLSDITVYPVINFRLCGRIL
jgi:hypothetical protein